MRSVFAKFCTLLIVIHSFVSVTAQSASITNNSDNVQVITSYPSWYPSTISTPKPIPSPPTPQPSYRIDGAIYPADLIGPSTHGPDPAFLKERVLRLNGESYNLKEAGSLSRRGDSYLPGASFGGGDPSDPDDYDTTPAPVQGAIDYVLLPLIFLAISGPLFVIMYIVMATVEFKLPPNNQLRETRSLNNRKHTYFNLASMYTESAKPLMTLLSRTLEHESCQERVACEVGAWVQPVRERSPEWYDYVEGFARMMVPPGFTKGYDTYMASARKEVDCLNFTCLTQT